MIYTHIKQPQSLHMCYVLLCLLLFLVHAQSAPLATAARNSNSDTGNVILVTVLGCFVLSLFCCWISGMLKCKDIGQIVT